MSFIRKGRPSYSTTCLNRRRKIGAKKRPAWDDTLTDLSAYRADPLDLVYRKKIHQSKHLPSVKFQTERNANKGDEVSLNLGKLSSKQLAIMREVLYDQDQLKAVLDYSDKMMEKVTDLCGDHPKRYQAFPSVTSAPNTEADVINNSHLPSEPPEYQSRLDILSSSVMDLSALNDEQEGEDKTSRAVTYTSQIDMERFRKLLENEETNLLNAQCISPERQLSATNPSINNHQVFRTPENNISEAFTVPKSAANDTTKINKVRKVVPEAESENQVSAGQQFVLNGTSQSGLSITDLKKVLEEMQNEMGIYEENTGKMPAEKQHGETFSGYTMSLFSTVIKLCRYLRETDEKLQMEKKLREELTVETARLKILVDALTSDLIQTQEKYNQLDGNMKEHQQRTQQELSVLKEQIQFPGNRGVSLTLPSLTTTVQQPLPSPQLSSSSMSHFPLSSNKSDIFMTEPGRNASQGAIQRPVSTDSNQCLTSVLEKHRENPSNNFRAAFQLSPPVQRTRVLSSNVNEQQESLVEVEDLAMRTPTHICQSVSFGKQCLAGVSALQNPSKQHIPSITIPKPVPLGQTQHFPPSNVQNCSERQDAANGPNLIQTAGPYVQTNISAPTFSTLIPATSASPERAEKEGSALETFLSPEPASRSFLAAQIEELNKQHQEAERLLELFLQSGKEQESFLTIGQQQEEASMPIPQPTATVSLTQVDNHQHTQGVDPLSIYPHPIVQGPPGELPRTLRYHGSSQQPFLYGVSPAISPIDIVNEQYLPVQLTAVPNQITARAKPSISKTGRESIFETN